MRDSLTQQAGLATAFLARAWPEALEQAQQALADGRGGVRRLLVCGCGDSHCAAQGAEFGMGLWSGRPVRSAESMHASRYPPPDAGPDLLVVGISSSGEAARTVEALENARHSGAATLAITCSPESTLVRVADKAIRIPLPAFPFGPGLISYLAALQACLAVASALSPDGTRLADLMGELPDHVERHRPEHEAQAQTFADDVAEADQGVILGSGPCRGAAEFAAAKVMEACGLFYRAQDVEEWAHLEYFVEPADMPTWLLTAEGRSRGREVEVEAAARAVGRRWLVSHWQAGEGWTREEREALAPLALWAGPVAFAQRLMAHRRAQPFRGFGGGRSVAEGGGASRIRSSERRRGWAEG